MLQRHVIVTGGAGFIGSHLVDRLLREGDRVTVIDSFDPFYDPAIKRANVRPHLRHAAFRLVEADVRDGARLLAALAGERADAIVHLAGRAGVRPSIAEPALYQDVNVGGTQQVLELARTLGVPRFVFASSSSVYGVNPNVPWREEDHVLRPISPYAATKVAGELLAHTYAHLFGLRVVALRFFTVYGPRQRPDLAIHRFAELMRRDAPVPVFGDGTTRRDYTYVDDVVAGIIAALGYDRSPYEVVNLGNSRTVGLLDLVDAVGAAVGATPRLRRLPAQPGDVPQTWAHVGKAEALLGWRPTTRLEEGLRRFAAWHAEQAGTREPAVAPARADGRVAPTVA